VYLLNNSSLHIYKCSLVNALKRKALKEKLMKKIISILLMVIMSISYAQKKLPYKNPKLPVEKRVEDLVNRMTLKEKMDLLGGTGFTTKENKRLGIPELKMSDGPLGVRWEKSSAFAGGIGAAATWDTSLVNKLGSAIGRELKGHGRDVILGPCVNIARLPMGGRNFESFGEDPYLTSRIAVSYIEGVQKENIAATVKHFAVNNQEYERMFVNVIISERALNEIYLPAFKAAITEAHSLAIMSAYNKVDGHFASENDYLLKTKLKDEWKFDGLVMSDWGAVHSTIPTAQGGLDLEMPTGQYLNNSTLAEAVKSGNVSEQTINDKVKRILTVIFKLGLFEHPRIADAGLLNTKENRETSLQIAREGIVLLKNSNNILPLNKDKIKSVAVIGPNAADARTGGGGSADVTPIYSISPLAALQNKIGKKVKINYAEGIAVNGTIIGSKYLSLPGGEGEGLYAEYFDNQSLEGKPAFTRTDKTVDFNWNSEGPRKGFRVDHFSTRWTGFLKVPKSGSYALDFLSDDGVRMYLDDQLVINNWTDHGTTLDTYKVTLDAGKKYKIKIEYYQNGGGAVAKFLWRSAVDDLIMQAANAAANSEVALVFVGTSDQYETEGKDRDNLVLPEGQDELINEVIKANKNTIVIITSGSPVLMNGWKDKVDGILETWFAGEEIGNAVADVILGNYNPSGKLPITFPKRWEDCSAYKSYKAQDSVSEYSDGIFVGYRHFDANNIEPLYPFGYGLSYTKFEYADLKVQESLKKNQPYYKVTFNLKNAGSIKGSEVAQLYVSAVDPKIERAPKELKAFKKISLKAGETGKIEINISQDAFSYYNTDKKAWTIDPGKYEILIGSSSRDIKLKNTVTVK
jgi:beta-glucosidase